MSENGKGRRRWLRLIVFVLVVTGVILGGLTLVLRLRFHGPALARLVEHELNTRIRGKVKIGSVEWAMGDLPGLAINGWMPVVIRDAKVYDADGELVIQAPLVTAEIDGHAGAFGDRELMVRNLVIPDGGHCRIRNVLSPEGDSYAVSLVTAFRSPSPPSFAAGQTSRGGPLIDLHDYEVRNATLEFEFPQFTARAENIAGKGTLHFDGTDPLVPRLYFKLKPQAGHSLLTVGDLPFEFSRLDVQTLELRDDKGGTDGIPHDLVYVANATGVDGAEFAAKGRILRFWTDRVGDAHDIDVDVTRGGPMARRLFGILGGGDDLTIHLDVEGPTVNPRVTVNAHRLGLDLPLSAPETAAETAPAPDTLPLIVDKGQLVFDLATESGTVDDAVISGMGGEIRGSALFTIRPMSFDVAAEVTRPLDVASRLPARVAKMAGTKLSGRLHARGTRVGQKLDPIDLTLGRARVTGAVTRNAAGVVWAQNVSATLDRTAVRELNGRIDLPQRSVDLAFGVKSTDLARWLRLFDAPAFATGVSGRGRVHGSFDDLRARGDLTASGVPVFSRVDADLGYENRTLLIHEAQSGAFDGWVRGSGRIHLDGGPRLEAGEAEAVRIDLSRVPGVGPMLSGRANGKIKADGRLTALRADASASIAGLQIGGEPYRDTTVQFAAEPDGQKSVNVHLERIAGGKLDIAASVDGRRRLGGALSLRDLPFESLAEVTGVSSDVAGGEIGAEVQLSGTLDAPTGEGYLSLARAYLREAFFGNANIEFERAGEGLVRISGQILQGRVKVEGTIETRAPFVADVTLKLRRVEIDQFLPAIAARASARGWVSGEVRWKAPLLLRPGDRPSISANLTEIVAVIDSEDAAGRPSPIRLRNRSPIAFTYDGVQLTLLEDAIIAGPTGDFVLSGAGSQRALGFKISGKVSVQLLEPYFRHLFEGMDGMLDIEIALGGSLEDWRVSGVIEIQDVAVKPLGQDAIVTVPHGKVLFDNDQVAITGVDVEVIDEFSDEQARLSVAGGIKLRDMKPAQWAIRIEGDLAGKMLLVAAPSLFSAAAGKAQISLALLGSGEMPDIDGTIDLAPPETTKKDQVITPLTFTPRGLRREIALTSGTIRFTGDLVELERVAGTVDDEGEILDVSGDISLANWKPESVDLTLSARGLPFRVPQTLDMSVNLERLEIVGGASGTGRGLEISGTAEIVDGRYIRKWRPVLDAFKQVRTTETTVPFYEAIPMLGGAQLKIALDVRSFYIRNNMASIDLSGDLVIAGTPRRPRFEGVVRVEQGEFKFQGVRAKFSRTNGTVTFSPFKEFPKDTPYLDIHSESDYRDLSGQDHLVVLSLSGPISNLNWDLGTAAGLNKAQTMTLILAGRRPDEARQALLGEEGIGRRPGDFAGTRTTAANDSSLAAATDELAKDLAGDIFSLLIEDPIKNFTTLDVARLEIGSQLSVGFHGEKEVTDSLRLLGDAERSLRGWTWDVRGQYRMTDNMSLDAEHLRKQFDDDVEEDENKTSIKLTWRRVLLP